MKLPKKRSAHRIKCIACQGTGLSSRLTPCVPCGKTGVGVPGIGQRVLFQDPFGRGAGVVIRVDDNAANSPHCRAWILIKEDGNKSREFWTNRHGVIAELE